MRSKRDREICGTCDFWPGNRRLSFSKGNKPTIDIIDRYACCACTASKFTGEARWRDNYCMHYLKWAEISQE